MSRSALAGFALLLVVSQVIATEPAPPKPRIPLGKETTFVTGPLDPDGYIDYSAALNAELSRGVKPQTNANALLMQVFGPAPEGTPLPAAFFQHLGIEPPPADKDYLISCHTFATQRLHLPKEEVEAVLNDWDEAMQQPWSVPDRHPAILAWLEAHEHALDRVVQAAQRPHYYHPLVSVQDGKPGMLIGALLPSVSLLRASLQGLQVRAMFRLKQGRADAAWQDILASHRLARHLSHGTLIEYLVGAAGQNLAERSTLVYLATSPPSRQAALARLKDLQALPPLGTVADVVDRCERLIGLDAIQHSARECHKGRVGEQEFGPNEPAIRLALEFVGADLDWGLILRQANQTYDQLVSAARRPGYADRIAAFHKLEKQLTENSENLLDLARVMRLVILKKKEELRQEVSRIVADQFTHLLTPGIKRIGLAEDRLRQRERNLHLAFALAAFHADKGHYPHQLADLAPTYIPAIPDDLFSGQPLIYQRTPTGYRLYSVGENLRDDGGKTRDEDPNADDLVVQMPLPARKKP